MRIWPGFDAHSPTLQRSPLGGDCMGDEFKRWKTAYLDRAALIFSGDLVQLGIRYDDGTITHILKGLRVTRDGRWWAACEHGVFPLGGLVQPTTIVKVVALSEEYYAPAPIVAKKASPETVAHFAELAREAVAEWAAIGHTDFVRFPGLDVVNYYSPTYRVPEPVA